MESQIKGKVSNGARRISQPPGRNQEIIAAIVVQELPETSQALPARVKEIITPTLLVHGLPENSGQITLMWISRSSYL